MVMNDRRSCGTDIRYSSKGMTTLGPRVVDGVRRQFLRTIIPFLEREHRSGLRVDERRQLLRVLVGHVARVEIRHGIADHAGERVDARRAGAVVPRPRSPERPGFLVADLHALSVGPMTGRATIAVDR